MEERHWHRRMEPSGAIEYRISSGNRLGVCREGMPSTALNELVLSLVTSEVEEEKTEIA